MRLNDLKKNFAFDYDCEMGKKKVGEEYKGKNLVSNKTRYSIATLKILGSFLEKKFAFG